MIYELKYREKKRVMAKDCQVKLECFQKGSSIGSSFWYIGLNSTKIGYLVEFNHHSEFHLDGFDLEQLIGKKFDYFITSSYKMSSERKTLSNKELTMKLVRIVENIISEQSNAIIVSDSYTRIFEYMNLLEKNICDTPSLKKQFTKNESEKQNDKNESIINRIAVKNVTLFFPNSLYHYMEIMKSLTEYMNSSFSQSMYFEEEQEWKMDFNIMGTINDVINCKGNKILLTTYTDLFYGKYHEVLDKWNTKDNHLIFIDNDNAHRRNNLGFKGHENYSVNSKYIYRPKKIPDQHIRYLIDVVPNAETATVKVDDKEAKEDKEKVNKEEAVKESKMDEEPIADKKDEEPEPVPFFKSEFTKKDEATEVKPSTSSKFFKFNAADDNSSEDEENDNKGQTQKTTQGLDIQDTVKEDKKLIEQKEHQETFKQSQMDEEDMKITQDDNFSVNSLNMSVAPTLIDDKKVEEEV